ncbi:hypothetical protein QN277_026731 [Acacia crassicarpa]|uniref:GRF-type domain-containing protein n=1 Tax=Acacia crassicarpa TaxID=499986 RepID=A0AAE1K4W1_9FABA|nr:hypothetical protein QN277_026731 [Acacia crassicarpa]
MGDSSASSMNGSQGRVARLRRGGRQLQYEGQARICHCGMVAPLCTSSTEQNLGRRFFGCRNYQKGIGCGFFQWLDGVMGARPTQVINERVGYVDRYDDGNVMQRRGIDNQVYVNVEEKIADIGLSIEKIDSRLKKVEGRLGLAICGLLFTWLLIVVYIVC